MATEPKPNKVVIEYMHEPPGIRHVWVDGHELFVKRVVVETSVNRFQTVTLEMVVAPKDLTVTYEMVVEPEDLTVYMK